MRDVREALMVARNSDGKPVRRPVSPHLDVYKWSLSMALSILHRASGIALAAGSLVLVWWLVAAARGAAPYEFVQGFLGSIFGWLLLFGWTVALWFHFCSGIRHLLWDAGKAEGEPMPEALKSDLRDFAGWLKMQHELGPDSPVAWRALRCFGLRQDA